MGNGFFIVAAANILAAVPVLFVLKPWHAKVVARAQFYCCGLLHVAGAAPADAALATVQRRRRT